MNARNVVEHEVDLAAEQVVQCLAAATIRDVNQLGAAHRLEQLGSQVVRGPLTAGSHREHAGFGLRQCDQVLHVFHWQRRVHDENQRHPVTMARTIVKLATGSNDSFGYSAGAAASEPVDA